MKVKAWVSVQSIVKDLETYGTTENFRALVHLSLKFFTDITDLTGFSKDEKKGLKPVKSFGTDDGFKSEAAQCGHSVVQVSKTLILPKF